MPKATLRSERARRSAAAQPGPRKSFHCGKCDRKIRVPKGWSVPPAVRRHYWSRHREVMPGGGDA